MYRNFHSAVNERQSILRLLALASLVAAGCGGEQAIRARDGGAAGVAGSQGGGGGGSAGSGGSAGRGGSAGGAGGSVTGSAGGGTGGSTGAGGTTGTGGGVSGNTGAGGGGTGGSGGTGGRPTGNSINGTSCASGDECMSSWCVDGVCCANACTGTCMRCDGATKGNCQPIADGSDPDNECTMDDPSTCGNTGDCNGAGACRKYGSSTVCDSTPSCAGGSIIMTKVCNGIGGANSCIANGTQSCNGFMCSGPTACGTSCGDDSACVSGAFCSAATCVGSPNIAGNGDLEYGTTTGWSAASGTSTIALTMAAGTVHDGQYAISDSVRMAYYQGPGYLLPTGLGAFKVSAWVFQKDPNTTTLTGALTVAVKCKDTTIMPTFINFAQTPMPQNSWAMISGTIDLNATTSVSDCNAAAGGLVRSVLLYLNQVEQGCTTGTCPDLYMDDLVVNITDGHNLVGNPNFEAGFTDSWGVSSGSAVQAVVTTFAHGGTHSLRQYSRQSPATGPRYLLPTGYGRYNVSLWVMQNGTVAHDLTLQSTYTCAQGGGAQTPPSTMTAPMVAPGAWTQLSGTVTLPPPNAMPGCKMTTAAVYVMQEGTACGSGSGQVECPDLYVDDASITMPMPTP